MRIANRKLLSLVAVPFAALILSGCGNQAAPVTPTTNSGMNTPNPALQNPQPPIDQTQDQSSDIGESTKLEQLPADSKQAIDTELDNIDKDIKSTDNSFKSTDLSNVNLGL